MKRNITKRFYWLTILIIVISLLQSCRQPNEPLNSYLNHCNEVNIKFAYQTNEMYRAIFTRTKYENPQKIQEFEKNIDTLQQIYENFIQIKKTTNNNISKQDITEITDKIYMYALNITKDDSELNTKIVNIFNSDKHLNIQLPDINLLENKILTIINLIYQNYHFKIQSDELRFNTFKPIVIPENNLVKSGQTYTATIIHAYIDTIRKMKAIIEDDTLIFVNGIAKYYYKPTAVGTYHKEGKILLESATAKDIKQEFVFDIDFKVIK